MSQRILVRRAALVLGAAAGLLNVNFLLEWGLSDRTPVAITMVSDLATHGRQWFQVFRLADALSALLLMALGALAWRAGSGRAWRSGTALLLLFAASTLFAVLFPEQCAASSDPSCPTQIDQQAWSDALHDVISSAGTICGVLACFAFAAATRTTRRQSAVHLVAGLLSGALGIVFVVAQQGGVTSWLGWTQRAQILVLSAWYAAVGWSVDARRTALATAPETMRR